MLRLRGNGFSVLRHDGAVLPRLMRVSEEAARPAVLAASEAYISRDGAMPPGFAWHICIGVSAAQNAQPLPPGAGAIFVSDEFAYLKSADVVRISPERGGLAVLYQRNARHHPILLTERCNHYCLMCSQPPRDVDDGWILQDVLDALPLIDPATHELGFTGGEPTLLGEGLVQLVRACKGYLPRTGLHILTNGRAFANLDYARAFAAIGHPDLMFGIPLYSDLSDRHDYVVQSDGAYDETVRGILHLKRAGVPIEIRVVIHKQTVGRLEALARFIARNLTFVDQVVLMGLEITGFTRANLPDLWIDPADYQPELAAATRVFANSRIKVSIYNHQMCVTDRSLWPFMRRSISDWKNEYMDACTPCAARSECGGFFSSAKLRYSDHIRPMTAAELS
jgi:His-Xaa-Ser system radical SAM maturase HxsC